MIGSEKYFMEQITLSLQVKSLTLTFYNEY